MTKTSKTDCEILKEWKKATLANNFIFYKVMRHHPDACKHLLEMLLNIRIKTMKMSNEEIIEVDKDAKGIRLDVYITESKRMYDIELQVINTKELPERSRYYSALMDLDNLKPGDNYQKLKDSHSIFICLEDVFDNGLPVNTFENICQEDGKTKLNDRSYKHFFIAPRCAKMLEDEELKSFFEFLISNKTANKYTSELDSYVKDAKKNMQWRIQFMNWERQRTYDIEYGKEQKAIEASINLLKMNLLSPKQIAKAEGLSLKKVLELQEQIAVKA
ncbi:MAG: Rpn family recombination-promoting nuclease/putative transposase [Treponema sp.]|nr:Rpn family recombination-promoting nuclease/putative transposase [Treponema sp.]